MLNAAPDLPLLYLFNQLVIAVILLHGASFLTAKVQLPKLDVQTAKKLTPVVSVNIIGLVFNTLCLRGVEASFFQIARGMVLPLTILVSCIHTHARPSAKVYIATGIVTVGFLTGISPSKGLPVSASPSVVSLIYGMLSSLFIAIHAVLIKASLPHCNNSTIELAYWTNLGSAVMAAPFILLNGELETLARLTRSTEWDGRTFVYGSMVTGVFGFLLCVAGLLSIKITSPITHMFSSVSVFWNAETGPRHLTFCVHRLRDLFYRRSWVSGCSVTSSLCTFAHIHRCHSGLITYTATGPFQFSSSAVAPCEWLPRWFEGIETLNRNFRYYTWVKHLENSKAPPKAPQGQKSDDVELGNDQEEHGLVTIFEAKEETDEEKVTLGHWSASRNGSDKA